MPDLNILEHVIGLAEELKCYRLAGLIIGDAASQHPECPDYKKTQEALARRSWLILAEIEALDFRVQGFAIPNLKDLDNVTYDVEIVVQPPKDDMDDEVRKIYDNWHAEAKTRYERLKLTF